MSDHVVVPLPTQTIEGTIGYVGETDVRIDPDNGYSWENEVLNKEQFVDALRRDERNAELFVEAAPEAAGNFKITDDHLGEGGAKQKYARNVAAIRTLLQLEQEHRGATAEEQEVLAQYVGWGGLADVFDKDKSNWTKEHAELKELLSGKEYEAARASTLNAHYTSPTVIRAIYDAVEKMGFRTGNILEPSMGVGNFFGMLPDTMQDSRLYGVELDSITGRIAQKLYPKAHITVAGFQTTDRRDFFDLAIGNVPFGAYGVNDRAYNKLNFSIANSEEYRGWYPLFTVMLGTGCRIGEVLGLRWQDVDFKNRTISINHNLVYRVQEDGTCTNHVNSPKTKAGIRIIPMLDEVFDAFLEEYQYQKVIGFCTDEIDGYSGFVFCTGDGKVYLPNAINRAIRSICADYNKEEESKAKEENRDPVLLPKFSCHILRHTFCTRFCENETNLKVIQEIMGHADISTTMDVYAEATQEKKKESMTSLQSALLVR